MIDSDRSSTLSAVARAPSSMEEEKLRVQTKEKKDQSKFRVVFSLIIWRRVFLSGANASAEVKNHLKSFLFRKLQKEGKLE